MRVETTLPVGRGEGATLQKCRSGAREGAGHVGEILLFRRIESEAREGRASMDAEWVR